MIHRIATLTVFSLTCLTRLFLFNSAESSEPYRLSTFTEDITIPIGHRCMGILPMKSTRVADPLEARGFVLSGDGEPIVVVALDWCEVRNGAYDRWRQVLADAAGTKRERVLLCSLHQHDAPVIDTDAGALLKEVGLENELYVETFHNETLIRVAKALRESLARSIPVTHVGTSQAIVEQIASSRRVVDASGKVGFSRGSSSGGEAVYRDAVEGEIDPALRTISFWNEDDCLLEIHSYATHPMSSYGKGEVSSDFVGLARRLRQRERPMAFQIYVSGCSGDVTAGKYNDGSAASRAGLIQRLHEAMVRSSDSVSKSPLTSIAFRKSPLLLEYSLNPDLSAEKLRSRLNDRELKPEQRILAAMGLASRNRVERNEPIDLVCVDLGMTQMVLFPGEAFVGYQIQAQSISPDCPIFPIGYGECWTGYIPLERDFQEGFGDSWLWVARGSQGRIEMGLREILRFDSSSNARQ